MSVQSVRASSGTRCEEIEESVGDGIRRLLSLVVAGVDGAVPQRAGEPGSPDAGWIAVDVKVVACGLQQQDRASDASPCVSVGGVVGAVDAEPGAVVLGHAVDH